jgi:hypothetical protein
MVTKKMMEVKKIKCKNRQNCSQIVGFYDKIIKRKLEIVMRGQIVTYLTDFEALSPRFSSGPQYRHGITE